MAFAEYNSAIQRSADKPQPKRDLDYDYEDDDEDEQIRAAGEDFGRY